MGTDGACSLLFAHRGRVYLNGRESIGLVRENPVVERLEPSQATGCMKAPDLSARESMIEYCLGLNQLLKRF
jgi:hypothetical protein